MTTPLIVLICLSAGIKIVESVIQVTGYVGGSAVIRCHYDRGYERYSKYLCRGLCRVGGKDVPIRTEGGQTKAVNDRFSLHDDTTTRVFTVTITKLTAEDSGQYWCGVKTGFGKTDVYSEVKLQTEKVAPPSPFTTPLPSTEGHTVSPSSPSSSSPSLPKSAPSSSPPLSLLPPSSSSPSVLASSTSRPDHDAGISISLVLYIAVGLGCLLVILFVALCLKNRHTAPQSGTMALPLTSSPVGQTSSSTAVVGEHMVPSESVYANVGTTEDPLYQNCGATNKR